MEQAQQVHQRSAHTPHARSHLFLWTTLLLPVMYVLSIGPACRLAGSGFISPDALEKIYAPVFLLAGHSTTIALLLHWYIFNVWKCHAWD